MDPRLDFFDGALAPDPDVALTPPPIPVRKKAGPLHRLQFVVEFVGPRSVPAAAASSLLSDQWFAALGQPEAFCMGPGDTEWRPLAPATSGSYDSLALAWNLVSDSGQLSEATARHLLATSEQFAGHIERRAIPLPLPEDVPKSVQLLRQVEQNFDVGISLLVLPPGGTVSEYELWVWCAKLGLNFDENEGVFEWVVPSTSLPLFTVSPLGGHEMFTIKGAQRGDAHEGALIGFNVPRSPDPKAALKGSLQAARYLARGMSGQVYDEDSRPLDVSGEDRLARELDTAIQALTKAGYTPGSPEALKLFAV